MADLVELVRYEADISDIKSKLDDLQGAQADLATEGENTSGRMGTAFGKVGGAIGGAAKAVGVGILGIAGAGAVFGPMILGQGAALDALEAKASTVFEGALTSVQTWADGNAAALGMTNTELVGTAAGIADLLKPMGFTAEAAAGMSTDMMDLSGALSAWSGGQTSATEAADIITKAMLGERDGLKALGISISEADVQAQLAKNGQEGLTGAALEQAKALATQELILAKSTDAQKAWADGSMDGTKAQNESKAAIANLKESLIRGLYPAFQAMLPAIKSIATWLSDHIPAAIEIAKQSWEKIKDAFGWLLDHKPILIGAMAAIGVVLVGAFAAWAISAGSAAVATIAATWPVLAIAAAVAALAAGIVYAYQNFDWFRTAVDAVGRFLRDTLWPIIQDVFGWLRDNIPPIIGAAVDWLQTMWDKSEGVRSLLAGAFKTGLDVAKTAIDVLWGALQTAADWFQTAWDKTEGLRSLLAGGAKAAWDAIVTAIDTTWGSMETLAGWFQTLWDKTDTLRSLIAGGFGTALDQLGTAFGVVKDVVMGVYNALRDTWDLMQKVLAPDLTGKIAPGAFGGGTVPPRAPGSATRIHSGGIVQGFGSLRADEIPAILQRGEVVLTPAQQGAVGGTNQRGPLVHIENATFTNGTDAAAVAHRVNFAMAG